MERLLTNFSHAYMGPSVPSHTYETKGKFKQRTLKSCIILLSHYCWQPVFWMESIGCDCFHFLTIHSKHSGEACWWARGPQSVLIQGNFLRLSTNTCNFPCYLVTAT